MKNIPDLDAKLQALSHSTNSILHRLRRSSTAIFKTRERSFLSGTYRSFLSGTYRTELWVNYPSIIEQITSKAERVQKFPNFGMAATL